MPDNKDKAAQREYLRAWRQRNPEKVKQYNINYWKRRALREEEKKDEKQ